MTPFTNLVRTCGWLVHKDLLREFRVPRVWPTMFLLGIILSFVLEMQIELPRDQKQKVIGVLLWLVVFFAWTVVLDRLFASERDESCWQALLLYPVTPGTIYLAKLVVNFLALTAVEVLLVPAFIIIAEVPLLARAGPFVAIVIAANLGFAAVGTLVSSLTSGITRQASLLVVLVLPIVSPIVIGAGQATVALLADDQTSSFRWLQLLSVFATLFVSLGALLFEFVIEE